MILRVPGISDAADGARSGCCGAALLCMLTFPVFATQATAFDTIVPADRQITETEARAALVHCEASLGHALSARQQCQTLRQETNASWRLRLSLADTSILWGDFHGAIQTYKAYLRLFPGDRPVAVRLAEAFKASQQFELAEGQYRQLLFDDPGDAQLLLALADVKRAEDDFASALEVLARIPDTDRWRAPVLAIQGDIFLSLKRFGDAEKAFAYLAETPDGQVSGQVGDGLACLRRGDSEAAFYKFIEVLSVEPRNVSARFYALLCTRYRHRIDLPRNMPSDVGVAGSLAWATLCQANGDSAAAIQCLEKIVRRDPLLFPAKLALAQALAADRRFDRAIRLFDELREQFPESDRILLEQARALAWARRYNDSIRLYDRLARQDPDNPVPAREMARVAVWAKRMDDAEAYYTRMLTPSVDSMLAEHLAAIPATARTAAMQEIIAQVEPRSQSGPPYDAYEWLYGPGVGVDTGTELAPELQRLRARLLPWYRIQKAFYLECAEKTLTWRNQRVRAIEYCRTLREFAPGNQEACYDLAQLELALGLNSAATNTTLELLDLDPTHNLAPTMLAKMDIMANTYLYTEGTFWHEAGRGDLADIQRQHGVFGAGMPLMGRGYFEVLAHHWDERPANPGDAFAAQGLSAQGGGVLSPWLHVNAGLTDKNYTDGAIPDTVTGHMEGKVNLRDTATLALRRERTDELCNGFAIEQGIQADSWLLKGHSFLTRYLEVDAFRRMLDYSDGNAGEQTHLNLAYSLTDHPRILKGALFGEMRDTRDATEYGYTGNVLTNVVYPYWTPQNYEAWGVMFEWYHDLSPVFSRGTDLRYYDLLLTLRNDSEQNTTIELKGRLNWEFHDRWALGLEAVLIRSEQWDAEGLQATLKRHF